jgi:glycosyltransferase A (GT-A) superfamily protein (DUF2064 family)
MGDAMGNAMGGVQLLLIAKAPVPGLVKTRLCPPATPAQAAAVAAAALADTVDALTATPAVRRTIVLSGRWPVPDGWHATPQRGDGLARRLANGFHDTTLPGTGSLLVGMDTPQLTPNLMAGAAAALCGFDAVLGLAADGGWWALGLREPSHARVLTGVPMSTVDTGARTLEALLGNGLRVGLLPELRDVDTAGDAHAVAALCRRGRFAAAVAAHLPAGVTR